MLFPLQAHKVAKETEAIRETIRLKELEGILLAYLLELQIIVYTYLTIRIYIS